MAVRSLLSSTSLSTPLPPPSLQPTKTQVITGFLGSGKTTLLNHLLTRPREPTKPGESPLPRLAVIENEFGEVDIDSALVASRDVLEGSGETVVTLSNGCLCCTVRDDLVRVLVELVTKPERRRTFDAIVIETTGLADPKPIIETFAAVEDVARHCRLDGVVALVDAVNGWRHLGEPIDLGSRKEGGSGEGRDFPAELFAKPPPEAVSQVAYADRIVLNKCDLVLDSVNAPSKGSKSSSSSSSSSSSKKKKKDPNKSLLGAGEAALKELEVRLRTINALAPLVRSTMNKNEVDPRWVLGVGGYDLNRVAEDVEEAMSVREAEEEEMKAKAAAAPCGNPAHGEPGHVCSHDHDHEHDHGHSHSHEGHSHEGHSHEGHSHSHEHSHEGHAHAHAHGAAEKKEEKKEKTVSVARHDEAISSVSIDIPGSMDLELVNMWLGALLDVRSEDMYRMKGILSIEGFPERYVFQGVHALFSGEPAQPWGEEEARRSRMVFIGRGLDPELLRAGFDECVVGEDGIAKGRRKLLEKEKERASAGVDV